MPENAMGALWAWKEVMVVCRKPTLDCDRAAGGVRCGVRRDVGGTRARVATATCFAAWAGPWACTFQCTLPSLPFPLAFAACEGSFLHGGNKTGKKVTGGTAEIDFRTLQHALRLQVMRTQYA